ncbi:MAG: hypothetical protein ACRYG8_49375 [Janthinobacterium lividum]
MAVPGVVQARRLDRRSVGASRGVDRACQIGPARSAAARRSARRPVLATLGQEVAPRAPLLQVASPREAPRPVMV